MWGQCGAQQDAEGRYLSSNTVTLILPTSSQIRGDLHLISSTLADPHPPWGLSWVPTWEDLAGSVEPFWALTHYYLCSNLVPAIGFTLIYLTQTSHQMQTAPLWRWFPEYVDPVSGSCGIPVGQRSPVPQFLLCFDCKCSSSGAISAWVHALDVTSTSWVSQGGVATSGV